MEQRDKSMGGKVTPPAPPETASLADDSVTEAAAEITRPARHVADSERSLQGAVQHGTETGEAKAKSKQLAVRKIRLRETRIEKMMSKAELARRANLSVLTIDRVEKGLGCRMDTKRKILEALGLSLADRVRVFGEEE
jgi:DNA-binding XRE family transcriptional regulator